MAHTGARHPTLWAALQLIIHSLCTVSVVDYVACWFSICWKHFLHFCEFEEFKYSIPLSKENNLKWLKDQ